MRSNSQAPDPDQGRIWAYDPDSAGSARFAGPEHLFERGYGPYGRHTLGYLPAQTPRSGALPITYGGARHQLLLAPTRGGKGVSGTMLRLLEHPGSAIVLSIKGGEEALITARYRQHVLGQTVILIDPFDEVAGELGFERAQINPMRSIDLEGDEAFDDAMLIASTLVLPSGAGENHWDGEAESMIAGVILREAELGGDLRDVRSVLNRDEEDWDAYIKAMGRSPYPLVRAAAGRLDAKEVREFSGVLSTAQRNTHCLESGPLAQALAGHTIDLAALGEDTTIYIVLPARRIGTARNWLRLLIGYLMYQITALEERPAEPVLFVLEEMATLGRMAIVEQAFGLMAGFGLQIMGVVQDLSQLKDTYRERWQTFVANAASLQCFGTNDSFTADYLSRLCGTATVETLSYESAQRRGDLLGDPHYRGPGDQAAARKLVTPEELMSLRPHLQLMALAGARPALAYRPVYFLDRRFRGRSGQPLYDIHPHHAHLDLPGAYDFTRPGLDLDGLLSTYLKVG